MKVTAKTVYASDKFNAPSAAMRDGAFVATIGKTTRAIIFWIEAGCKES
jgi:hypothetical protein